MSLCYIVTLRTLLNIIVMLSFMLYADCFIILSVVVLKVIMLSAVKLSFLFLSDVLCHYAECCVPECHYDGIVRRIAKRHSAEFRGPKKKSAPWSKS